VSVSVFVYSVEAVPAALNPVRVAVVLEALQSHKKYDNAAEDAGILFALLARSSPLSAIYIYIIFLFTTLVIHLLFLLIDVKCAHSYFNLIYVWFVIFLISRMFYIFIFKRSQSTPQQQQIWFYDE